MFPFLFVRAKQFTRPGFSAPRKRGTNCTKKSHLVTPGWQIVAALITLQTLLRKERKEMIKWCHNFKVLKDFLLLAKYVKSWTRLDQKTSEQKKWSNPLLLNETIELNSDRQLKQERFHKKREPCQRGPAHLCSNIKSKYYTQSSHLNSAYI